MIRLLLATIVCTLLSLYLFLPVAVGIYSALPGPTGESLAPPGVREARIESSDSIQLALWYKPPENGAVIVLIPGSRKSKRSMLPYAAFLEKAGYGWLALDLRGHGESGGHGNAWGWEAAGDVEAAIRFLNGCAEVDAIGGLGISLGGEVLLGALGVATELEAIVSDGAAYRSLLDYSELEENVPLFRSWMTRVMFFALALFSGDREPEVSIRSSIILHPEVPLLLIAAEDEKTEVKYNQLYISAASDKSESWIIPEAGHGEGYFRFPQRYEELVIRFFAAHLTGKAQRTEEVEYIVTE